MMARLTRPGDKIKTKTGVPMRVEHFEGGVLCRSIGLGWPYLCRYSEDVYIIEAAPGPPQIQIPIEV